MFQFLIGIIIFAAWFIVGCAVLAFIDDENKSLFNWCKSCPVPGGYEIAVLAWPVITFYWLRQRKGA
ncbi:hypothetical protein LJR071_003573 [Pseudomonas sp. LjRoot71]|uniref:hypothetical protein n=1 Tax=Pseudomonas sp. LjRoot71 TaxID=3342336 RepID=UPI003ECDDB5B